MPGKTILLALAEEIKDNGLDLFNTSVEMDTDDHSTDHYEVLFGSSLTEKEKKIVREIIIEFGGKNIKFRSKAKNRATFVKFNIY